MSPLLRFQDVGRSFRTASGLQTVLQNLNVELYAGEFAAITGPSGSGKSTFLNLCALLDEPSSGEVFFDGASTSRLSEDKLDRLRKQSVGMVFQHYCLLPYRSVLDNVLFRFRYLAMDKYEVQKLAWDALAMVGMAEHAQRQTNLLSGGEMQRVGIARAIALRPRVLVADEPTGNLDRKSAEQVMRCLKQLGDAGDMAILLVTHDESLLRFASRHLQCDSGSLSEASTMTTRSFHDSKRPP